MSGRQGRSGRPLNLPTDTRAGMVATYRSGASIRDVAAQYDVGYGTAWKILRAATREQFGSG